MKFEKPGPKVKNRPKTKRKYIHDIEVPANRSCKLCNRETGTERYIHAEAKKIKFLIGGGIMGGKIDDKLTIWACYKCTVHLDSTKDDLEQSILIIKTWLI